MLTIVKLEDVKGGPQVKMDLPEGLRMGDPLKIRFQAQRKNGGRSEVLDIDHVGRVDKVGYDASTAPHRRILSVSFAGKPPQWVAVKKLPVKALGAAKQPPKNI